MEISQKNTVVISPLWNKQLFFRRCHLVRVWDQRLTLEKKGSLEPSPSDTLNNCFNTVSFMFQLTLIREWRNNSQR
jgi:hypothetical protein